jgi:hypothetical protein
MESVFQAIRSLAWERMNPHHIVWVTCQMGQEYAESVRIAEKLYSNDPVVLHFVSEELETDNLSYGEYVQRGDHWKFLEYFLTRGESFVTPEELQRVVVAANARIGLFSPRERAMTVFLREQQGSREKHRILAAHDWDGLGLGYFRYYLERHIELDSQEGGHGSLAERFVIDPVVAQRFYEIRFSIYEMCLSSSFVVLPY